MRRFRIYKPIAIFCCALSAYAQTPPAPAKGAAQAKPSAAAAKEEEETVIKVDTRLVVQQVTVKDKSGKPIEGLTAKDFTITENGQPQTVAFLEFQKLAETQAPAPVLTERVAAVPRLANSQIATERPLDLKYSDRRLIALYFDM